MNTAFLLMAQYNGAAVIPLETVCRDYFRHLKPDQFAAKALAGQIAIPIVRIDGNSAKTARGIHLMDLAAWIDERREAGRIECEQLTGVSREQHRYDIPPDREPSPGQTPRSRRIWANRASQR